MTRPGLTDAGGAGRLSRPDEHIDACGVGNRRLIVGLAGGWACHAEAFGEGGYESL